MSACCRKIASMPKKVIRDSLQSRSPFKLEFRITVKDGIRHIRAPRQPGTE